MEIMQLVVCLIIKKEFNTWPSNTTYLYNISIASCFELARSHQASFRTI